jgi:hypothetical protein
MRTSIFVRAGAVITASALAFSLGAGPATAAETESATTYAPAPAAQRFGTSPVGTAAVPTGPARFGSSVITGAPTTRFVGNGSFAGPGGATAAISINGVPKGNVGVLFEQVPGSTTIALDIPRQWGSGKVQANIGGFVSNVFYARKLVTTTRSDNKPLRINRRNNKMTFRAFGVKVINPSSGQLQSVKRVKLQQLRGSKWKTLKTIKLDSKGSGSYRTSIKKKYRYRLYITRSATQEKFETIKTRKI